MVRSLLSMANPVCADRDPMLPPRARRHWRSGRQNAFHRPQAIPEARGFTDPIADTGSDGVSPRLGQAFLPDSMMIGASGKKA